MKFVVDILMLLFCLIAISDVTSNAVIACFALGISALILIYNHFKLYKKNYKYLPFKFMCLFLLLVSIEIIISGNIPVEYLLSRYSLFFPIIIFLFYRSSSNNIKILNIVMIIWGIIAVRACYLYSTGVIAARAIAAHQQTDVAFSGGGYGFAVGSSILAVYLFEMMIWRKIKCNIIYIAYIALLCYTVILTQSTTTILALFIGLIFALILKIFQVESIIKLKKKQAIGLIMTVAAALIILGMKENIGDLILNIAKNGEGIVSQRFYEVGVMLSAGTSSLDSSSDMLGRIDLLASSIKTFLQYPIFGLVARYGTNFYILSSLGVGSHGEFFDAFAEFGLFAGVPYVLIFISTFFVERKEQYNSIGFGYIVTFCVLFFFNPFLYLQVNICIFFIIPLLTRIINSNCEEGLKC